MYKFWKNVNPAVVLRTITLNKCTSSGKIKNLFTPQRGYGRIFTKYEGIVIKDTVL